MISDHVTFMAALLSSLVAAMSMLEGTGKGSGGGRFQLPWILESALRLWDAIWTVTTMLDFSGTDALVVPFFAGPCAGRAAGDPVQVQCAHWQGCLEPVFLALHPVDQMLSAVCRG